MSFGYGVGDCIVIGRLAYKTFEYFKEAPETFHYLHTEVLALHSALERAKQTLRNAALPSQSQSDLNTIFKNCDNVLRSLNELTVKYKRVGEKTKSPVDRIRFSNEDIGTLRQRLIASTMLLTMFMALVDTIFALPVFLLIPIPQDLHISFPAGAD